MSSTGCQFRGERLSVPYTVYVRVDEPRSGVQLMYGILLVTEIETTNSPSSTLAGSKPASQLA